MRSDDLRLRVSGFGLVVRELRVRELRVMGLRLRGLRVKVEGSRVG